MTQITEEITDEVDIDDDVNALLGGEELSEEFREKQKQFSRPHSRQKLPNLRKLLEQQYEEKLERRGRSMKDELVERVDSYLEYVADEWLQENQLAVENVELRTEMTQSFLVE